MGGQKSNDGSLGGDGGAEAVAHSAVSMTSTPCGGRDSGGPLDPSQCRTACSAHHSTRAQHSVACTSIRESGCLAQSGPVAHFRTQCTDQLVRANRGQPLAIHSPLPIAPPATRCSVRPQACSPFAVLSDRR